MAQSLKNPVVAGINAIFKFLDPIIAVDGGQEKDGKRNQSHHQIGQHFTDHIDPIPGKIVIILIL